MVNAGVFGRRRHTKPGLGNETGIHFGQARHIRQNGIAFHAGNAEYPQTSRAGGLDRGADIDENQIDIAGQQVIPTLPAQHPGKAPSSF